MIRLSNLPSLIVSFVLSAMTLLVAVTISAPVKAQTDIKSMQDSLRAAFIETLTENSRSQQDFEALKAFCPSCDLGPLYSTVKLLPDQAKDIDIVKLGQQANQARQAYDARLWEAAKQTKQGQAQYQSRCFKCERLPDLAGLADLQDQYAQLQDQRRQPCMALAAPKQYGGKDSWAIDVKQALSVCQPLLRAWPKDPWLSYLVWRLSQNLDQSLVLDQNAKVAPAIAALAFQALKRGQLAEAKKLAAQAAGMGDWGGISLNVAIDHSLASHSQTALLNRLTPALEGQHTLAMRARAQIVGGSEARALLTQARDLGDPVALSQWYAALKTFAQNPNTAAQALQTYLDFYAKKDAVIRADFKLAKTTLPRPMVKVLQARLQTLGHLEDEPDGLWGNNTQRAFDKASIAALIDLGEKELAALKDEARAEDAEEAAQQAEPEKPGSQSPEPPAPAPVSTNQDPLPRPKPQFLWSEERRSKALPSAVPIPKKPDPFKALD